MNNNPETRKREWIYKEYLSREIGEVHAPFESEFEFYDTVKRGDLRNIKGFIDEPLYQKPLGKLSDNPLHNMMYHFVICASMLARFCIEGGMSHDEAYGLSDFYIQKGDKCTTLEELSDIHIAMVMDYTGKMHELRKTTVHSKPINRCINYIYDHLHTRIKVDDLAAYVKLNPSYLSKLFIKEMGIPISEYITQQKIEASKNMLRFSDLNAAQISSILAYPTQSYFTEVFKKQVGMTPLEYRKNMPANRMM